jgi:hypothetical protein
MKRDDDQVKIENKMIAERRETSGRFCGLFRLDISLNVNSLWRHRSYWTFNLKGFQIKSCNLQGYLPPCRTEI